MSSGPTDQCGSSEEGEAEQIRSFCAEDMMNRMAEACGCGPMVVARAASGEQPGRAAEPGDPRCCGGGDTEAAPDPGDSSGAVA